MNEFVKLFKKFKVVDFVFICFKICEMLIFLLLGNLKLFVIWFKLLICRWLMWMIKLIEGFKVIV